MIYESRGAKRCRQVMEKKKGKILKWGKEQS
jgi:hypothetical protein